MDTPRHGPDCVDASQTHVDPDPPRRNAAAITDKASTRLPVLKRGRAGGPHPNMTGVPLRGAEDTGSEGPTGQDAEGGARGAPGREGPRSCRVRLPATALPDGAQ